MKRLFFLIGVLAIAGCQLSTLDKVKVVVTALDKGTVSAGSAFSDYDLKAQQKIVDDDKAAGKTPDQMQADIAGYRAKRQPVYDSFIKVMIILDKGHNLIPLVESGVNKDTDLVIWVNEAIPAVSGLIAVLQAFGVTVPFAVPATL